jgi:hypothetical protein
MLSHKNKKKYLIYIPKFCLMKIAYLEGPFSTIIKVGEVGRSRSLHIKTMTVIAY